jgi:hypothetical protein
MTIQAIIIFSNILDNAALSANEGMVRHEY